MLFDDQRLPRQGVQVCIVEGKPQPVGFGDIDGLYALAAPDRGVHHLDRLAAEIAAHDCLPSGAQGGFVDVELIGVDRSLHDCLAEAVRGGDEDDVAET